MKKNELLTINEVAGTLGIHPQSVYQAIRENRLPFVRRYDKKLVALSDVEAYRQRTQINGIKPKGRPRSHTNG